MRKKFLTDVASQRVRLLAALRERPVTTIEARRDLDIMMPAARVYELRHMFGHNIVLNWIYQSTGLVQHRVGQYTLLNGKWGAE